MNNDTQQNNLQEMKFRFSDDVTYRFIDADIDELLQVIDDFNYNKINDIINNSKYADKHKHNGHKSLTPIKPVKPIVEHIIQSVPKAFYDCVAGIYSPIPHADTIPLEAYARIKPEQVIKHTHVKRINHFKQKENILHLGTHTRCICAETGISFGVALPSPLDTSMTMLHPFAFYNNVQHFIKQYQRNGIPLSGIDSQALAGMLITTLKHKGYAICRDYVAANLRLRTINKKSLTWALAYFYRASIRDNLPQINLLAEGNPTTQLIGFVQICRGEDITLQAHHALAPKQDKIKAKVYQTEHAKEAAILRNDVKVCLDLMETLQANNPTIITDQLITAFEQRVRKLAIMNDAAKEILIADIIGCFGENSQTKQMELIIRSNDMTATQKELLTFSMEIAKEIAEFKQEKTSTKLSFAALRGKA